MKNNIKSLFLLLLLTFIAISANANMIMNASVHFSAPSAPKGLDCTAGNTQVACLWFEPAANGDQITDYKGEFKLASEPTVWTTFTDGVSTDTAMTFTSLINGLSYDFRTSAINSIGTGPVSSTETKIPVGAGASDLSDLLTDTVVCWNGNVYSGSGDWLNQTTSPADGSAQADSDVTPSNTSLHDADEKWVMDNTANFDIVTNTSFFANLGRTSGGTDWTMIGRFKTPPASRQLDSVFGTADDNLDYGVVARVDSGGNLKLDQFDGTTKVTQQHATLLPIASVVNIGIKYNFTTDTIGWAVNEDVWSTESGGWTVSSTVATDPLKLASEGGGNADMETDAEIYTICFLNDDITNAELVIANDWLDAQHPTAAPTAPDAPNSIVSMASDTQVFIAWDLLDDGGASITDYLIDYKLNTEPTVWTLFSDGTSTSKFTAVTGLTNNLLYDFRVAAVNSIGTSVESVTDSDTPQTEGTNPYDETEFKITQPVNSAGDREGNANEILAAAIGTHEDTWFGRYNSKFGFNCVFPGATTATATFARSEMRGLTGGKQFIYTDDSDETIKFRVTDCPTSAGNTKVVTSQIHDADAPIYKLVYDCKSGVGNDTMRTLTKLGDGDSDTTVTIKSGITRGDWNTFRAFYDGDGSSHGGQQTIEYYVNGTLEQSHNMARTGANDPMYHKRGNYCQLGPAGSITTVEHMAP